MAWTEIYFTSFEISLIQCASTGSKIVGTLYLLGAFLIHLISHTLHIVHQTFTKKCVVPENSKIVSIQPLPPLMEGIGNSRGWGEWL